MKIRTSILVIGVFLFLFPACQYENQKEATSKQSPLSQDEKAEYLTKGSEMVDATFSALATQLQRSLAEGGIKNAISYCKLSAYPITDSLAKVFNAEIKRTSSKVRNPDNSPSELEAEILALFEKQKRAGQEIRPLVRISDSQEKGKTKRQTKHTSQFVNYFAPIQVNSFCLQCHGEIGKTLTAETQTLISSHFPTDKAVGYADGDLRGMWSIRFERSQLSYLTE